MRRLATIAPRALLVAALLVLYAWILSGMASAQSGASERLIAAVARVAFNEAGDSYVDAALIWQVVEGHGSSAVERLAWLRSHSPCVAGRWTQDRARTRPGNCRWSRNLRRDGRIPRGWPWTQGAWARERPRWLAHVVRVRALVDGRDPYRPCRETPVTWDGLRWQERAEARGWRAVECDPGARNAGYVRRGR